MVSEVPQRLAVTLGRCLGQPDLPPGDRVGGLPGKVYRILSWGLPRPETGHGGLQNPPPPALLCTRPPPPPHLRLCLSTEPTEGLCRPGSPICSPRFLLEPDAVRLLPLLPETTPQDSPGLPLGLGASPGSDRLLVCCVRGPFGAPRVHLPGTGLLWGSQQSRSRRTHLLQVLRCVAHLEASRWEEGHPKGQGWYTAGAS